MYRKILVPMDMSALDQIGKSLDVAVDLARHFEAELMLLTVGDFWRMKDPDAISGLEATFMEFLRDASAAAGLKIGGAFRCGESVSGTIQEAAQEHGVDLIVMWSHDPVMADYVLGSRATTVALHTPCSVLIVR